MSVFISYARDDSPFALELAQKLKAARAAVWIDQLDIPPGERWDRAVESALQDCATLLFVMSPASVKSENVMDEVNFAIDEKKRVVPVWYLDCKIPLRLRRLQHADCRTDIDAGIAQLLAALTLKSMPVEATEKPELLRELVTPAAVENLPAVPRSAKQPATEARRWLIAGRVQGVGFREFAGRKASELGLHGWVRNLSDGRVEVYAVGMGGPLGEMLASLKVGPGMARVENVDEAKAKIETVAGFSIR